MVSVDHAAARARQDIIPVATVKYGTAITDKEFVIAGPAVERAVVGQTKQQDIVASLAIERELGSNASKLVIELRASKVLNTHERVRAAPSVALPFHHIIDVDIEADCDARCRCSIGSGVDPGTTV